MATTISELLNKYGSDRKNLIPILQEVQEKEGYLSAESISELSSYLGISENDIYSVASRCCRARSSSMATAGSVLPAHTRF